MTRKKVKTLSKTGKKKIKTYKKAGKISPDIYWKFRCAIEQMQHEETRVLLAQKQREIHRLEMEMAQLKLSSCDGTIKRQNQAAQESKKDYDDIVQNIEKDLGVGLSNCEIDPVTYEVTKGG